MRSQLLDVQKPDEFQRAFQTAVKQRADVLVTSNDALLVENARAIVELAAKYRLPAIYPSGQFVSVGGLIFYGVSYPDLYYRSATFVHKIFNATKPAEIPVEQPTKFELVINIRHWPAAIIAATTPRTHGVAPATGWAALFRCKNESAPRTRSTQTGVAIPDTLILPVSA